MSAVRRGRPALHRPRRTAIAGARLARRQRPAPPKKRRWPRVLLAAAALLALWIFWPAASDPPGEAAAKGSSVKLSGPPPDKPEPPARKVAARPPPRPPAATVSPLLRARRDLLLAAVRARSPSLRACVNAAEVHVPVRLHVERTGSVKSLEFAGEPPPRELRDCVRRVAGSWNFQGVELPSDVELLVTLALTPGA